MYLTTHMHVSVSSTRQGGLRKQTSRRPVQGHTLCLWFEKYVLDMISHVLLPMEFRPHETDVVGFGRRHHGDQPNDIHHASGLNGLLGMRKLQALGTHCLLGVRNLLCVAFINLKDIR